MAYALCAALAHLAAAAATTETSAEGELGSLGQGRRDLGCWVEAADCRAQGCGWDGDDRAAEHGARSKPVNSFCHQAGDREQATELEGGNQVASYGLVRCR